MGEGLYDRVECLKIVIDFFMNFILMTEGVALMQLYVWEHIVRFLHTNFLIYIFEIWLG